MSHPFGEEKQQLSEAGLTGLSVDIFSGKLHVERNPQAALTGLGQLPFFIEFLKLGGLFEPWVGDCPLALTSPNASSKRDLLGTLLLSVLSGHQRYSHVTSLRGDGVNPSLLGMSKVVSEDALRRALSRIEEQAGVQWLQKHLGICYEPLLCQPWILDTDVTVKPLYGHQQGAEVGYNPQKPGRPSHTYHSYIIANLRLLGDCENHYDELKNHWGWGGFTTQDIKRCRLLARSVALIYNWWSLFVRLANPHQHTEAMTSHPLMLHAVGRQTEHAGQTKLTITSAHGKADKIRLALKRISIFFDRLRSTAEQLNQKQRWVRILEAAMVKYLQGRPLQPPNLALATP
jgi:hypothetical protein